MGIYLIHGIFYKEQYPDHGARHARTSPFLKDGLQRYDFFGHIYPNLTGFGYELAGELRDPLGPSWLCDICLGDLYMKFTKTYGSDGGSIRFEYDFWFEEGIWVGEYCGPEFGSGVSKCVLTEVPMNYFDPPL